MASEIGEEGTITKLPEESGFGEGRAFIATIAVKEQNGSFGMGYGNIPARKVQAIGGRDGNSFEGGIRQLGGDSFGQANAEEDDTEFFQRIHLFRLPVVGGAGGVEVGELIGVEGGYNIQ